MSVFSIFKKGLEKSATRISRAISGIFTGVKSHNKADFEELEDLLISSDFGVVAAHRIVETVRDKYERGLLKTDTDLLIAMHDEIKTVLSSNVRPLNTPEQGMPLVILMVGVNGSGKTTSIGKLAWRWTNEGKKVILAACDTFRAAAMEQLKLWGERTGVQVVSSVHGADPAAVAFDATQAAVARKADVLIIDTAGRQQNQKALMDELAKIVRSIRKVYPNAPQEVWLTVDSTLGANVVEQARGFASCCGVTGLILTKLDGTGRGGMALALHQEFNLPTFFIGLGEQPDDLQEFDASYYADALLDKMNFDNQGK